MRFGLPIRLKQDPPLHALQALIAVDKKNASADAAGAVARVVLLRDVGALVEPRASVVPRAVIDRVLSRGLFVEPTGRVVGVVKVPGSKSLSNRALLLAAMGRGECRLTGLLLSDDTLHMIDALTALAKSDTPPFVWDGDTLIVQGCAGRLTPPPSPLFLGNSGTSSRFLTALCAFLFGPLGGVRNAGGGVELTGDARMCERPIGDLVDAVAAVGARVSYVGATGALPIRVLGPDTYGGATVELSASVSSQFLSGLLMAATLAPAPTTILLKEARPVSEPFVKMTLRVIAEFTRQDDAVFTPDARTFIVKGGGYANPPLYAIEGDASSAAPPLTFAALSAGEVTVANLRPPHGADASAQGDAAFAWEVLARMGAEVSYTPPGPDGEGGGVTVRGPAALAPFGVMDLSDVTDCFLTAAVAAACARGRSEITNIANQRVKECDRIAAMAAELRRVGARVEERPDGLVIEGGGVEALRGGVVVRCYDDHRIAMSFALLGAVVEGGGGVEDARCVEKTYPTFWDDAARSLRLSVRPLEGGGCSDVPKHILFIGMRGAGKTTLGQIVAAKLGLAFIDADDAFAAANGDIKEFVSAHGWSAFRREEAALLSSACGAPSACLIACGGGVVETADGRAALAAARAKGHLVLFLNRAFEAVEETLRCDPSRAPLGETPAVTWARREPLLRGGCTLEVPFVAGASPWPVAMTLIDVITRVLDPPPPPVALADALILSAPLADVATLPLASLVGADAVELRADYFLNFGDEYIRLQIATLRSLTSLPIVFTVRSAAEGGRFDGGADEAARMLLTAARCGVDFVDVEVTRFPSDAFDKLVKACVASRVIASFHTPPGESASMASLRRVAHELATVGAHVAKLAALVVSAEEALAVHSLAAEVSREYSKPFISVAMGRTGAISRLLCPVTFVTHPSLQPAAPGQLTAAQIQKLRADVGIADRTKFFLFGSPVARSASPAMHNAAFAARRLPFVYDRKDVREASRVAEAFADDCAGGSVTVPLKEDVARECCDRLDASARMIGAVNTATVRKLVDGSSGGRCVWGGNTDWLGFVALLRRCGANCKKVLILGGGGTARAAMFAALMEGCAVFVWNRTVDRARALQEEFWGVQVAPHVPSRF